MQAETSAGRHEDSGRLRLNRTTLTKLVVVAGIMFGFGYALVPIYNVAGEQLGLNGRSSALSQATTTADTPASAGSTETPARMVTVEFVGNAGQGLEWDFHPNTPRMQVRVGELVETTYHVRNRAAHTIVGQAVPSVAPGSAARHFHKIQCFCFEEQTLKPGETLDMPVVFFVDPEIVKDPDLRTVDTITLSYTFYPADDAQTVSSREQAGEPIKN